VPSNFFRGFSVNVILIIAVSVVLGMAVSLILKHCNVIIKLYAQAIHSPLEVVAAHLVLGTELTFMIIAASLLIAISTVTYYLGRHKVNNTASKDISRTDKSGAPPSSAATAYVDPPEMEPAPYPAERQQHLLSAKQRPSSYYS